MRTFAELPVSRGLFVLVLAALFVLPTRAEDVTTVEEITDNLRITTSVKFKKGRYVVRDADGNGVLHVAADGITIDLDGVELWGSAEAAADTFSGVGVAVHGRRNVTIVNASVHGYKYNIRVEDSSGVSIRRCDVSHSLAPRISRDGEKIRIWLGLRSLDAWRSYGAGIWIESSRQCVVEACRGQNAANGLLAVDTTESSFRSNDFSFVSGWGIGLYRSSRNEVFWNRLDFVGRPWGGSVGADAAALVLVHSCNGNWVVGNSLTHSGDGFFLTNSNDYGGGKFTGGSEDNVIAFNDGSYSPHNAFEGTFSERNYYVRNLSSHSAYGYWLGFSSHNVLLENQINRNQVDGIAIEHAEGTVVVGNELIGNGNSAVHLWANPSRRELFPSRNSYVARNTITDCGRALHLGDSTQLTFTGNTLERVSDVGLVDSGESTKSFSAEEFWRGPVGRRLRELQAELKKQPPMYSVDPTLPRGLLWYAWDGWSPRDFRKDRCTFAADAAGRLHVWIIDGELQPLESQRGFTLRPTDNQRHFVVESTLEGVRHVGGEKDLSLLMRGRSGERHKVDFTLDDVLWQVRYFEPDFGMDDDSEWQRLFEGEAVLVKTQRRLTDRWKDERQRGSRWAFLATTVYRFHEGRYKFVTVSDDGVRVYVDDELIIDNWTHHAATTDARTVRLSGEHRVTVRYCQDGGGSAFSLDWIRQ